MKRVVFDWTESALPRAARWLIGRYGRKTEAVDLSAVLVCVPGGQARRRLLELLVELAAERRSLFTPPQIITPGALPEKLYTPKRPFAAPLTQQLAWAATLKNYSPPQLQPLVRNLPAADDLAGWLELGKMLSRLHQELAGDCLDFESALAAMKSAPPDREKQRWKLLADLQRQYLALLDRLETWDMQTARVVAIERRECQAPADIVLVGLVDLNRTQRKMLDQVAERVTALIFAPPHSPDGTPFNELFDEHGCLQPGAWQTFQPRLADDQIELAEGPPQQADAVVRQLAALGGDYAADDIVVGTPDATLVPFIEQRLSEAAVHGRYAGGIEVQRTEPYLLLSLAADFIELRRFRDLAALVRHSAVGRWLVSDEPGAGVRADCLTLFDRFYAAHLPAYVTETWPEKGEGLEGMRHVQGVLTALLADLSGPGRPLGQWAAPIFELLSTLYGLKPLDEFDHRDRLVLRSCEAIRDAALPLAEIDGELSPKVTGPQAIRLILAEVEKDTVPPPADRAAIELTGWLDLPWTDSPVAIVTGFNEGCISPAIAGDMFLPNTLRRELGLVDNDRHFARDLYAIGMLAASKQRLHVIAGRRSVEKHPLAPSRLLLACHDGALGKRVLRLFDAPPAKKPLLLPNTIRPGKPKTLIPVPEPMPLAEPVMSLRVTEFRDYLACPYRYYLRHRLKLEALIDSAAELDGGAFGSLLHEALKTFYDSEERDSTDPGAIRDVLCQTLGQLAARFYGKAAHPAVQVQIEQAKARLWAFADQQARWRGEGWKINAVESDVADGAAWIEVDGEKIGLRGRVDRIDVNERTGAWAVLDYKSGETALIPDAVHRRQGEWIDLQLPLYRYLVRALRPEATDIHLGYVLLPRDPTRCEFALAPWSAADLRLADQQAQEVIRKIRAGIFGPPVSPPPDTFPEFSAICQDGGYVDLELAGALDEAEEGAA